MPDNNVVLKVENAYKFFAGTAAVNNVNLEVREKEVMALMGENGAGKSTLCKMIIGVHPFDGGKLYLRGQEVVFHSPKEAMKAGIGMVFQERNLVGLLNGAQNIFLGIEATKNGFISDKEAMKRSIELRDKLGLSVPLDVPVEKLGAGEQQLIEILRAFNQNPSIIILDEPTASLGEGEVEPFLNFIKNIKNTMNVSVIFISHKLEEVYSICDRITVLTDGKSVITASTEEMPQEECISKMMRTSKADREILVKDKDFTQAPVILESKSAFYDRKDHDVQITVHNGEIVGFYGLVGSGRTEYAEVLFGHRTSKTKDITFMGQKLTKKENPGTMLEKGLILTPEKRSQGAFRSLSLIDNICLMYNKHRLSNKLGFVDFKESARIADEILRVNKVKYHLPTSLISSLSGGNMQKVILGRALGMENLHLLIIDEPTTGMDIGSKFQIYHRIREFVDDETSGRNMGVIFISSELEELLICCDRIYVFANGNSVGSFARADFDRYKILSTAVRGHME